MTQLRARDVMSSDVTVISPKAFVVDAARMMLERRITGLPVVDDSGKLVGLISEGDLLRRVEIGTDTQSTDAFFSFELARQFLKSHGRYVEDVMTTKVTSVLANTPLAEIAQLMQLMRLKRVPVTDHGKVVGVVSRTDVLRVLVNSMHASETGAA